LLLLLPLSLYMPMPSFSDIGLQAYAAISPSCLLMVISRFAAARDIFCPPRHIRRAADL